MSAAPFDRNKTKEAKLGELITGTTATRCTSRWCRWNMKNWNGREVLAAVLLVGMLVAFVAFVVWCDHQERMAKIKAGVPTGLLR